jgi:hypothetical protein
VEHNFLTGTLPSTMVQNVEQRRVTFFDVNTNCFDQPFDEGLIKACNVTNFPSCFLLPQQIAGYCP